MSTNKTVKFQVNGMHCEGCAGKIKRSVGDLHIEHTLSVDVKSGKVNIQFNSAETNIAKLKDSITQVGFQVEKVELE
jgi:copper chaperone